jgi:hypothetical protein
VDVGKLCERLRGLDALLRREGMPRGPDAWQAVFDLLARLDGQGRLPDDMARLAPLLGPLFCRNPEEQSRFPRLFQEWLDGAARPVPADIGAPAQAPLARRHLALAAFERRWRLAFALGAALLALGAAVWLHAFQPADAPQPPKPPAPIQIAEKPGPAPKPERTAQRRLALVEQVPPRLQPMPLELPAAWRFWLDAAGYGLAATPPLLALLWLLHHYRLRQRLRL